MSKMKYGWIWILMVAVAVPVAAQGAIDLTVAGSSVQNESSVEQALEALPAGQAWQLQVRDAGGAALPGAEVKWGAQVLPAKAGAPTVYELDAALMSPGSKTLVVFMDPAAAASRSSRTPGRSPAAEPLVEPPAPPPPASRSAGRS